MTYRQQVWLPVPLPWTADGCFCCCHHPSVWYVSLLFLCGVKQSLIRHVCLLQVLQLKQKPHEGRECDKEKEAQQEYVGHGQRFAPAAAKLHCPKRPLTKTSNADQSQQLLPIQP